MNSPPMLILTIERGNIILKTFNSYYNENDEDKRTNCSFGNGNLNLSFESCNQTLYYDSNNLYLGIESNISIDDKIEKKLIFTKFLKNEWKSEIGNIKNKTLDKYIFERFPF